MTGHSGACETAGRAPCPPRARGPPRGRPVAAAPIHWPGSSAHCAAFPRRELRRGGTREPAASTREPCGGPDGRGSSSAGPDTTSASRNKPAGEHPLNRKVSRENPSGAPATTASPGSACVLPPTPQPASRGRTYPAAFWGWSGPAAQPGCPGWPGRAGCRGRCPGPAPRGRASGPPAATRTAEARATGGRQFPLRPPAPPDTVLPTEDRPAEGGVGRPDFWARPALRLDAAAATRPFTERRPAAPAGGTCPQHGDKD